MFKKQLTRKTAQVLLALAATLPLLNGCGTATKLNDAEVVAEIRPGILQGYLPMTELPDSLKLISPPPAPNSAAFDFDLEVNTAMLLLRDTPRWDLAAQDANLYFPAAAGTFACAINGAITEVDTPNLYMLLRRTLADAGLSTYTAKNNYRRPRPFMVNMQPTCTPAEEAHLREDGSYPSGHSAIGWAWALILAEVVPARREAILARGRAFSQSRAVCNVHWQSDVIEGRSMGAAAVALLHADPLFVETVAKAREEVKSVQARGIPPQRDCQAEARALNTFSSSSPWPTGAASPVGKAED